MNLRSSSSNPNLLKLRFTKGFLRSLMRIYRHRSKSSSSPREILQRYRKIKLAADASMALAVGSKRLWSRAVLQRIRNQVSNRHAFVKRVSSHAIRKRAQKEKKEEDQYHLGYDDQENKLRKLVPGGAAMDVDSLLDETTHYINCLNTQVKMMRRIAEICST